MVNSSCLNFFTHGHNVYQIYFELYVRSKVLIKFISDMLKHAFILSDSVQIIIISKLQCYLSEYGKF